MTTRHPSPCTPRSRRTYATRGRAFVRLETRVIQGLSWCGSRDATTKKGNERACFAGSVRRFLPPLHTVIVIVIDVSDFPVINDNYRYRYCYRIPFSLVKDRWICSLYHISTGITYVRVLVYTYASAVFSFYASSEGAAMNHDLFRIGTKNRGH